MPSEYLDKGGLARYDAKIKDYIADAVAGSAGGGTKKYRHNITAKWTGGSGASYYDGSLSLSFIDSTSSSYSTDGNRAYNDQTFFAFLKSHIALKQNEENHIPASGAVSKGSGSTTEVRVITSINYHGDYDTWYARFAYIGPSSRGVADNYAQGDNLFPNISGNYIMLYDFVEEL